MRVCCLISSEQRVDGSYFLKLETAYPSFPRAMWSWVIEGEDEFEQRIKVGFEILRETIAQFGVHLSGNYIVNLSDLKQGITTRVIFFPGRST